MQISASLFAALKESDQSGHVFQMVSDRIGSLACLRRLHRTPPDSSGRDAFVARATPQLQGQVSSRAAVLDDEDRSRFFGVSLADNGMQAVWFSVKNANYFSYRRLPPARTSVDLDQQEHAMLCFYQPSDR